MKESPKGDDGRGEADDPRCPRTAETYALLTDGRTVQIRPARASDRAQVRALYEGMSPETLKRRFFGAGDRLHEREVDRIFAARGSDLLVLLAFHGSQLIGTAQYEKLPEDPATAEIGLTVADEFQHRGVRCSSGSCASGARTTTVGQGARPATPMLTEPRSVPARAPWPRVPTTRT